MNCKQCADLLVDYSFGGLPPESSIAVENHLHNCSACSADLANLQQLETLLDRAEQPSVQLQVNFAVRLATEIALKKHVPASSARPGAGFFQAWWPSRPAAALCYSFALLACGVVSGQLLPPSTLGIGGEYVLQGNARDGLLQSCLVPGPVNNDVL